MGAEAKVRARAERLEPPRPAYESAPPDRARVLVSVCSPVHDEAGNLREFITRVAASLESAGYTNWEAVLADDGSTDGSGDLLDEIATHDARVRVIHHATNLGEWAAWKTVFAASRGGVVCMLASDLQPPPEELPKLLDLVVIDGFDVGTGRRTDRSDGPFYRTATFVLTRFANIFWDLGVRDVSSSFFAVRGDLARQAKMLRNDHRYILAIFRAMGASIAEVDTIRHASRRYGHSHYKKSKVVRAVPEVALFTIRLLGGYYADRKTQCGTSS